MNTLISSSLLLVFLVGFSTALHLNHHKAQWMALKQVETHIHRQKQALVLAKRERHHQQAMCRTVLASAVEPARLDDNSTKCENGGTPVRGYDLCYCPSDYRGEHCEYPYCYPYMGYPNENNSCTCYDGFSGVHCSVADCQNGGTSADDGHCICPANWRGQFCETPYCWQGYPNENNTCTCYEHYSGQDCTMPECQNGGTPNEYGYCDCPDKYSGFFCEYPHCDFGYMSENDTTCICNEGYTGEYCSHPECQHGGNATEYGWCDCPDNYYGRFCEKLNCYYGYENDNGTCTCTWPDYTGEFCKTPVCQNGGTPSEYDCSCPPGFKGPNCKIPLPMEAPTRVPKETTIIPGTVPPPSLSSAGIPQKHHVIRA